jgi:DNA-binding response OmpR family regulator
VDIPKKVIGTARALETGAMGVNEPVTILVVDDYEDGRELMSAMLRAEGYRVIQASTGNEALERAVERPTLMMLDVNLPDIDGFEVCRRVKGDPKTADIGVVHVSAAYREPEFRVRGLEGGADAYLPLPVDRVELLATVRALLRIREAERERASLLAVTRLANAAAHDINNPLSVIAGQLHFLARDPVVPAARVQKMQEAADRIGEIVRRMSQLARLELKKQHPALPEMFELEPKPPAAKPGAAGPEATPPAA